ncbi:proton pump complex cytochrome B SoxC [Stygiolobus caldivivus]|uniref:Cytochrome b6 n=1 Tax=Stygiolobus caldivivus TaxID=2824673 RepID=A0A8D5U8S0_9CREN|nr:proton pump complex cytochrome B SoxC [Stygiolobus caldivivus]BCU71494.1 cytochrome b6 [Stygiolobus caldivivus]
MFERVKNWFKERINMDDLPFFRTPDYMYHVGDWLGALVAGAFFYTVISGLILLLYYNPEAGYEATQTIINKVPYGSVVLYSHLYGAYAMIILAYIHMFRNYFVGAYKKPRELVWILGVLMLAITLGTSFLGYSLIGDVLATSAVDVGAGILSSMGLGFLVPIFFGNYSAGDYARVLGLHIIFVALIGLLFIVHFFLADVQYGMMPSRKVKDKVPAVYPKAQWTKFNPWWPRNFIYMMSLVFLTWGFILIVPNLLVYLNGLPQIANPFLNPKPAPPPNSPAAASVTTYPPWFFLFLYKIADFPATLTENIVIGVFIPLIYLLIVPFIDRTDELHPLKRKLFTWIGVVMIVFLIQTSLWGDLAPGVPVTWSQVFEAYLPPAIISAVGIWLIPPPSKANYKALVNPLTMLGFVTITIMFVGSVFEIMVSPSLSSVVLVGLFASAFVTLGKLLSPYITRTESGSVEKASISGNESKLIIKKNIAEILMIVLMIIAIVIAANMWTIPTTGYFSNLFGVDLGILFVIIGEEFSLYHYIVYKKPVEPEE